MKGLAQLEDMPVVTEDGTRLGRIFEVRSPGRAETEPTYTERPARYVTRAQRTESAAAVAVPAGVWAAPRELAPTSSAAPSTRRRRIMAPSRSGDTCSRSGSRTDTR